MELESLQITLSQFLLFVFSKCWYRKKHASRTNVDFIAELCLVVLCTSLFGEHRGISQEMEERGLSSQDIILMGWKV